MRNGGIGMGLWYAYFYHFIDPHHWNNLRNLRLYHKAKNTGDYYTWKWLTDYLI